MDIQLISSRQNQMIRKAASLANVDSRRKNNMFLAEGARLCADAAESGVKILRLFLTSKAADKYQFYLKPLMERAQEIYIVEEHVAQLLSQTKHTQGIFCQCEIPQRSRQMLRGKSVVFEDMQDPANLGAVMRTAEALNMDHVILLGTRQELYAPKVLRASMGAVFRQKVSEFADREELFQALEEAKSVSYAAALTNTELQIGGFTFPENAAVFIGNEGNGLSQETIGYCDFIITIPMKGRAESLNAATAASIIMWEMVRDI